MITLPRGALKKQEILQKIAENFEEDKEYLEQEVNEIIKSFYVDDYVLFRRELVNFNYLGKDSYKGIYWLKTKRLNQGQLDKIKGNRDRIKKLS